MEGLFVAHCMEVLHTKVFSSVTSQTCCAMYCANCVGWRLYVQYVQDDLLPQPAEE